jgi:hypothetical protein
MEFLQDPCFVGGLIGFLDENIPQAADDPRRHASLPDHLQDRYQFKAKLSAPEREELSDQDLRGKIQERFHKQLCACRFDFIEIALMYLHGLEFGIHHQGRKQEPLHVRRSGKSRKGITAFDEHDLVAMQSPGNFHASEEMADAEDVLAVEHDFHERIKSTG